MRLGHSSSILPFVGIHNVSIFCDKFYICGHISAQSLQFMHQQQVDVFFVGHSPLDSELQSEFNRLSSFKLPRSALVRASRQYVEYELYLN